MIKLTNLSKIFNYNMPNEFSALDDINLDIKEGSVVVFNGVSGSGKSTLLSIISGMSRPTSGGVEVDGLSIAKLPDMHISRFRNKSIGFVFQSFNLFSELSAAENVSLPLIPLGLSQKELNERVSKTLSMINIEHKKDETVKNLSGGEKQRCAIARALINEPKVILCDEPTASLDEENSLRFIEIIRSLKNSNRTIIIATHDPIFKELDIVDEIVNIRSGKIVKEL